MKCINCGYGFEAHTCITSEKAELQDRDISICFNCGEVHQLQNGILKLIDIKYLPVETQNEIEIVIVSLQMVKMRY